MKDRQTDTYTYTCQLIFDMLWLAQRLGTRNPPPASKHSPGTPKAPKPPLAPQSHSGKWPLGLGSLHPLHPHGVMGIPSFLPVSSPCRSKGPASVDPSSHWPLVFYWSIKKQLGTRTFSVWTRRFLILGTGLIQSIKTNPRWVVHHVSGLTLKTTPYTGPN